MRNGRQNGVVPERVLTPAHLNRALLARQRFLERDSLPLPRLLEAIGGIQDQYAPAGYIGSWTRLRLGAPRAGSARGRGELTTRVTEPTDRRPC